MTMRGRIVAGLVYALCTAGCAIDGVMPTAVVSSARPKVLAPERATQTVLVGKTKAEVIAALGETLVIRFDSGFEVWVYRLPDDAGLNPFAARARSDKAWPRTPPELVILFAPSGVVAKSRMRPAS